MIGLTKFREFVEHTLKDRIFMGAFQEKRYVNKLNSYKDVIVLDHQEVSLCDDLCKIKNQFLSSNPSTNWMCFTEPHDIGAPAEFCIWTELDSEQSKNATPNEATITFGDYWFQIKEIEFTFTTIDVKLKILRAIEPVATISATSALSRAQNVIAEIDTTKIQKYVQQNIIEVDWLMLINQWWTAVNQSAYRFFSSEVNWTNIVYCIQSIAIFLVFCLKMIVGFIQYLGEFTLKLVFELTKFFRAITPISLALINLIAKIIGGFYILLAMIWRDLFGMKNQMARTPKPNASMSRPAITYGRYSRANDYSRRTYQ